MKNKSFQTILYSAVGVLLVFIIVVAINVIVGVAKKRVDLTEERAYTLSPGTKAILGKLDSRVTIRFYCSQGDEMPVFFKTYARRVEDLLGEYKQAGKGKIVIEKYNPTPDSDAEDSARLNGIEGQMIQSGERIYLGIVVSLLDEKAALPFITPDRERLLEYDISRAISRVITPEKPVVGVMSAFPVFGQPANPMAQRMGQPAGGQEPWVFLSELKNDFDVQQVDLNTEKISDDIKVLLVVHPRNITETAQYAIDQFVLRGGKLIAFIDPMAYFDQQNNQFAQFGGGGGNSSLDKLLKAWGVEMESGKVAADRVLGARSQQGAAMPAVLLMNKNAMSSNDVVTSQINSLVLPFPGTFSGTPAPGLKETVLLKTTTDSQLVDGLMASMSGEQISKEFKSSGKELPIAIRLTGKFKTAFPEGKPEHEHKEGEEPHEEDAKSEASLKESIAENAVILVADADMLQDQVSVEVQNFFGQRILRPINDNLNFVQSLVEQLSGDSNLINLRSRASMHRPFIRINEMRAKADANYQSKIKEMEESLAEAQRNLNELQRAKGDSGQKFILSPEQQVEIEKFQKKEAEVKIALKEERKKLRKETDSLELWTKVINIGGMPVAVAFAGLALAVIKRKRTAAK